MPRLTNATPKYRHHRASGQAVVMISGKDHYLGPHGTKTAENFKPILAMLKQRYGHTPAAEAQRLSDQVVSRLQTMLEEPCVQRYSTWIFTTTNRGQESLFADKFDACPFLSRANVLEYESRGDQLVLDHACHVRKIAQAEGCDGKPIADYIALVKKHKHNVHSCLMAVEAGAMLE